MQRYPSKFIINSNPQFHSGKSPNYSLSPLPLNWSISYSDEIFQRQHELNSSLVIKIDPEVDIDTDDSSTDEDRPFIKSKTGEFTYLDADEELLEPFERLGWFSGRPNYYFAENIFIWVRKDRVLCGLK